MVEIDNYELSKKTTFHIGGLAKKLYIPESEKELISLLKKELKNEKIYIISGGSNLLINDNKVFDHVIDAKSVDDSIKKISEGKYYIGCSNKIQKVINEINKDGYGGFEELVSLPALFGGIVCMNAGTGSRKAPLFTISDFIVEVKVIDINKKEIKWMKKKDCEFGHRHSIFQNGSYFILGAIIKVKKQPIEKSKERIKNRLSRTKRCEYGKGCFGTCFSVGSSKLLRIVSLLTIDKKGVYQSKNNSNWLVNDGTGTYNKTMKIINRCIRIHKLFHKNIECEVRIWK